MSTNARKVLKGHFPKQALEKMSRKRLEKFVLELVECSSSKCGAPSQAKDFQGLYRGLCLKQINTPEWWPSEQIIAQSLTADGKCFMEILRFLVYKCCQFFQKSSCSQSLNDTVSVNDDTKCNAVAQKRRTLIPQNLTARTRSASPIVHIEYNTVVSLTDVLKPQKPITQEGFLNGFGLQKTFSPIIDEDPTITSISSSIKFNNSSNIPFSSELGRLLMRRDNHFCPEALKARRLEKLEWYINKPINRPSNNKYEITYQEKKDSYLDRKFKYPKRQIWQHSGDVDFQKKALFCRPLKVVLVRQDLKKLQRKFSVRLTKLNIKSKKIIAKPRAAVTVRRASNRALRPRNRCGDSCC